MRENLPAFFGFEAVGILMYDFEKDQFFTDRDTAEDVVKQPHDESEASDEELSNDDEGSPTKKKKQEGEQIDYQALAEDLTPAQRTEKLKAIYHKPFMTFPTASGLSGHVFKTRQPYFSNHAAKESKFNKEMDNQSRATEERSFLLAPVFGESNTETPQAVIQLINKLETKDKTAPQGITQEDVAKFQSMQKLLGMAVETANEMVATMKMTFGVQAVMGNIGQHMSSQADMEQQNEGEQILGDLKKHLT